MLTECGGALDALPALGRSLIPLLFSFMILGHVKLFPIFVKYHSVAFLSYLRTCAEGLHRIKSTWLARGQLESSMISGSSQGDSFPLDILDLTCIFVLQRNCTYL